MKYKKICLILAAAMMMSSVAGCADDKKDSKPDSQAEVTTQPAVTEDIPQYDDYKLLFNDEFSGQGLDTDIWDYDPHEPGWTNNELQEYTTSEENVFLRDGKLVLKAIRTEDSSGKDYYTSGKIKSQNKKDFKYGKVVVSAKVPEGQGLWPAIWMMPTDEGFYGQWPKCGEIDIMEVLGSDVATAYGTVHYGEPHAEQQGTYKLENGTFAGDFHEYSVEWEPGEMRWYIDGNLFKTVNDWFSAVEGEDDKPYPAPFNQNFFVQLNLAVGGTWPGNPDETTDFNKAEFEVDYVRVYQKDSYDENVTKPEKEYRKALEDGNFIYNGDFSEDESLDDDTNWKFLLFENGAGTASIKDNMLTIESTNAGDVDYSVQLVQPEIPMIKGKKYKLTFDAYADEERDIIVCVSAPTNGWVRYLKDTTQKITTDMQTYTFEFEMTGKDDPNGRLEFNLGHRGSTAAFHLTNVRIEEIS
ncbi:MAG: family 16 glycosylhydrolase [Oscillospiraceae bacterium]|nr:family 16 glycosylhydrolase [Oscillospiraceae bacterium]